MFDGVLEVPIFTLHDIPPILVGFCSMVFSVRLLVGFSGARVSELCLALFLFCLSIHSFSILLLWNVSLKEICFSISPVVIFTYLSAKLIKGAALYFYVVSLSNASFKFSAWHSLYLLLPLLFSAVCVFSGFGVANAVTASGSNLISSDFIEGIVPMVPCIYAICAFGILLRADKKLEEYYSSHIQTIPLVPKVLVLSYLILWSWRFLAHLFQYLFDAELIKPIMGLTANYLSVILFFALFFYSSSAIRKKLTMALNVLNEQQDSEIKTKYCIREIEWGMDTKQLYLDSRINIERFSTEICCSVKDVSNAINKHYKTNFFEFINARRVKHAKNLIKENRSVSMKEVIRQSGFNSKSSFYRSFKRMTGMSPLAYRDSLSIASLQDENPNAVELV